MVWRAVYKFLEDQEWMESVSEVVQSGVLNAYESGGAAGTRVKNCLHGTWFGHPLHPALVTVPLGAWTFAALADLAGALTDDKALDSAADAAVTTGLVGAVAAALSGITDWSAVDPPARRLGLAHALINSGVAGLYATSLVLRRTGARAPARGIGWLAWSASLVSSHIGGELIYGRGVGVNHAAGDQSGAGDWMAVLPEAGLPENEPVSVDAGGTPVVLARQNGRVYALLESCSHFGGPLGEGDLGPGTITCPWHGSTFALADGSVKSGPATFPQPCVATRVRDGQIEVRLEKSPL